MTKLIIVIFSMLLFATPAEAQILKKLKKKVEKKVEDKVTDKASDKAAEKTGSMMDQMMNNQMNNAMMPMGGEQISIEEVPAEYSFTWKYNAKINTTQGNMDMVYRLQKDASYMGIEMPQAGNNTFMVMDSQKNLMVMFFNSEGNKMLMASRMDSSQGQNEEEFYKDAQLREIAGKKILDYDCKGYEVETDGHLIKFYVTNEPDVSFIHMYQHEKNRMPPGIKEEWLKNGEGLLMEMQMVDKKDPKNNATMLCTGLKKESYNIQKGNYNSRYGN